MASEPFALSQCATITSLEFERLPKDKYLMEPKVDGWRMQIDVDGDHIRAWTRTQHIADRKMPMVEHELRKAVPAGHHIRLDGEAVLIDESGKPDYNLTARCLGSGTEVCIDKQRELGRYLTYVVFDVLLVDNHDLRGMQLLERKIELAKLNLESEHVKPIMGKKPSYGLHAHYFEQFKEGSVLKLVSSTYAGRRNKSWLKWKEIETVDVRIIGYKEGQGKFIGLIGAIQWQAPDGTIGFCSGMDDETRVFISNNREALIGRIIEIKHFGKLVDGYRHPQFIRFRADKV